MGDNTLAPVFVGLATGVALVAIFSFFQNPIFPVFQKDLDDLEIRLERTTCYGTCPSYVVLVHGNGTVQYDGRLYVAVPGKRNYTISQDDVRRLVGHFHDSDFFSLKDDYGTCIDCPTYTATFMLGDMKKTVRYNSYTAPPIISDLDEQIDILSGSGVLARCLDGWRVASIDEGGCVRTTLIERYPSTSFHPSNHTLEEAKEIVKEAVGNSTCSISTFTEDDDPTLYEALMPNVVTFEYLEPPLPVLRIGCSYTPGGPTYFYVSEANGTLVAAEGMLTINSAEQAIEYLRLYPLAYVQFIFGEDEYLEILNESELIEDSPIRQLYVVDDGVAFTVSLNLVDSHSGEVRYEKWVVTEKPDADGFHVWNPAKSTVVARLHSMV
jgi:hypothetical protein